MACNRNYRLVSHWQARDTCSNEFTGDGQALQIVAPLPQEICMLYHAVAFCCILISWAKFLVPCVSSNVSSQRIVPQWLLWNSFTSWTVYSGGLENSGPKISQTGLPQTRHCEGSCPLQPQGLLQAAGVQEGEHLTAVAQQAKVAVSLTAFAGALEATRSLHGAIHLQWLPVSWRSTQ